MTNTQRPDLPEDVFRGIRFCNDMIRFINGTDFEWSQPEWTLSQFCHHWRRNNVLPFYDGEVSCTITTTKLPNIGNKVWNLVTSASAMRNKANLIGRVFDSLKLDIPKLSPRLSHRLYNLDPSFHNRIETCLAGGSEQDELRKACTEWLENAILLNNEALARTDNDIRSLEGYKVDHELVVPGEARPEWLLRHIFLNSPKHLWMPKRNEGHPIHIGINCKIQGYNLQFSRSNLFNLSPMRGQQEDWRTPDSFRVLGPRVLGWGWGEVARNMGAGNIVTEWDYGAQMVFPAREAYTTGPVKKKNHHAKRQATELTPVNPVALMKGTAVRQNYDVWDARHLRIRWAALSRYEQDHIRELKENAWVHHAFNLNEYRFLSAIKLLPVGRTMTDYKEFHRLAEIRVGVEEMERQIAPQFSMEDVPF